MQVVLTRVFRGEKETKFGPRQSVGIKTQQHGDKWVSALFDPKKGPNGTENWKEGDTVEIFVTEKDGYINYTLKPSEGSVATEKTQALEARVKKLEDKVFGGTINPFQKDAPDFVEDDF